MHPSSYFCLKCLSWTRDYYYVNSEGKLAQDLCRLNLFQRIIRAIGLFGAYSYTYREKVMPAALKSVIDPNQTWTDTAKKELTDFIFKKENTHHFLLTPAKTSDSLNIQFHVIFQSRMSTVQFRLAVPTNNIDIHKNEKIKDTVAFFFIEKSALASRRITLKHNPIHSVSGGSCHTEQHIQRGYFFLLNALYHSKLLSGIDLIYRMDDDSAARSFGFHKDANEPHLKIDKTELPTIIQKHPHLLGSNIPQISLDFFVE